MCFVCNRKRGKPNKVNQSKSSYISKCAACHCIVLYGIFKKRERKKKKKNPSYFFIKWYTTWRPKTNIILWSRKSNDNPSFGYIKKG